LSFLLKHELSNYFANMACASQFTPSIGFNSSPLSALIQ
jgi:hypothetical protein